MADHQGGGHQGRVSCECRYAENHERQVGMNSHRIFFLFGTLATAAAGPAVAQTAPAAGVAESTQSVARSAWRCFDPRLFPYMGPSGVSLV